MSAPSPLAEITDLETWLGQEIAPGDLDRAAAVLAAASRRARAEARQPDWVLDTVPDDVRDIVVAVATRVFRNPAGVIADTTGPFTVRYSEQAGQGLYLTDDEQRVLQGYRPGTSSRGLWTLRTSRLSYDDGTVYVPVDIGGDPFPLLQREE